MERKDWMIAGEMILVGLIFVCAILIGTAWANTLYYGPEISYNASLTDANNSYVHQGDNITQGNYYDLSGIYGFSGILAHWNDDFDNAGVTEPDYMFTIISPYAVYIDPAKFPVGRWYQWDGGVGCYGGTNTNNNGGTILGATLITRRGCAQTGLGTIMRMCSRWLRQLQPRSSRSFIQ